MGPVSRTARKQTISKDTSRVIGTPVQCVLCCKITYADGPDKAFGQLGNGHEKECFEVLLRFLQVSADPFLSVPDDWSDGNFTFCVTCGGFVKRGFLLGEEIQSLQLQQKLIKKKVLAILEEGIQLNHREAVKGSVKARNILSQCYKRCEVNLHGEWNDGSENVRNISWASAEFPQRKAKGRQAKASANFAQCDSISAARFLLIPKEEDPLATDVLPELAGHVAVSEERRCSEFGADDYILPSLNRFDHWDASSSTGGGDDMWTMESTELYDHAAHPHPTVPHEIELRQTEDCEPAWTKECDELINPETRKTPKKKRAAPNRPLVLASKQEVDTYVRKQRALVARGRARELTTPAILDLQSATTTDRRSSRVSKNPASAKTIPAILSKPMPALAPEPFHKFITLEQPPRGLQVVQQNRKAMNAMQAMRKRKFLADHPHLEISPGANTKLRLVTSKHSMPRGNETLREWRERLGKSNSTQQSVTLDCPATASGLQLSDPVLHTISQWKRNAFMGVTSRKETDQTLKNVELEEMEIPVTQFWGRNEGVWKCGICSFFYMQRSVLQAHFNTAHDLLCYHGCLLCKKCGSIHVIQDLVDQKYFSEQHYKCTPVKSHKLYDCYECRRPCHDLQDKVCHYLRLHFGATENPTKKSANTTVNQLGPVTRRKQKPAATSVPSTLLECAFCEEVYNLADKQKFISHVRAAHRLLYHKIYDQSDQEGYACENCGSIYSTNESETSAKSFIEEHSRCVETVIHNFHQSRRSEEDQPSHAESADEPNSVVSFVEEDFNVDFDKEYRTLRTNQNKTCPLCQFDVSENEEAYEYHLKATHGLSYRKNMYGCRRCGQVYNKVNHRGLRNFVDKHALCKRGEWMKRSNKCQLCYRRLFGFSFMVDHLVDHFEKKYTTAEPAEVTKEADENPMSQSFFQFQANTYTDISEAPAPEENEVSNSRTVSYVIPPTKTCPFCRLSLPSPRISNAVREHILQVHKLTYYDGLTGCSNCGDIYIPRKKISYQAFEKKHENCTRNEHAELECQICKHKSSSFLQKIAHYKTKHYKWERRPDPTPSEPVVKLPKTASIQLHKKEKCALCPMTFDTTTKDQLPEHVISLHNISYVDRVYGCGICGVLYSADLKCGIEKFRMEHKSCAPSSIQVELKCKKCDYTTDTFAQLVSHAKTAHPATSFWCFVCGKRCATGSELKLHYTKYHSVLFPTEEVSSNENLVIVTPEESELTDLNCEICNVRFFASEKIDYTRHMKFWHNLNLLQGLLSCCGCSRIYVKQQGSSLKEFENNHTNCTPSDKRVFTCSECGKNLPRLSLLCSHFKTMHLKLTKFTCGICHKRFNKYPNIADHIWKQHKKKVPYRLRENPSFNSKSNTADPDSEVVCPSCTHSEKTLSRLAYHYVRCHENSSFRCRDCGTKLTSQQEIEEHFRTVHSEGQISVSEDSRLILLDKSTGRELPPVHEVNTPEKCMLCDVEVSLHDAAYHYVHSHSLLNTKDFFGCMGCNSIYGDISDQRLVDFAAAHAMCPFRAERAKQCKLCDSKFPVFTSLIEHYQRDHEKLLTDCKECGKVCRNSGETLKHRLFHQNPDLKRVHKCPDCPRKFSTMLILRTHRKSHAAPQGAVYRCNICLKENSSFRENRIHSKVHLADLKKNRVCNKCGKPTPTVEAYKNHIKVHKRDAPASMKKPRCSLCKQTFLTDRIYQFHCKSIHNGIIMDNIQTDPEENSTGEDYMEYEPAELNTTCELCKKTLETRKAYTNHLKSAHTKRKQATTILKRKPLTAKQAQMERTNNLLKLRQNRKTAKFKGSQRSQAAHESAITQVGKKAREVTRKMRDLSTPKKKTTRNQKSSSSPKSKPRGTLPKPKKHTKLVSDSGKKKRRATTVCTVCTRSYEDRKAFLHHVCHTEKSTKSPSKNLTTTSLRKNDETPRMSSQNFGPDTSAPLAEHQLGGEGAQSEIVPTSFPTALTEANSNSITEIQIFSEEQHEGFIPDPESTITVNYEDLITLFDS